MIEDAGTITSIAGLLEVVSAAGPSWFRGQSQAGWDLAPGLLRPFRDSTRPILLEDLRKLERTVNRRFSLRGSRFRNVVVGNSDEVDLYIRAQHGGLPTRLLDWSENPLAALFFAVEMDEHVDAALFHLTIPSLGTVKEERSAELELLIYNLLESEPDFPIGHLIHVDDETLAAPVLLSPFVREGRIDQQSARFTFHFNRDDWSSVSVHKFVVPAYAKPAIEFQLQRLNTRRSTSTTSPPTFREAIGGLPPGSQLIAPQG